MKLIRVFLFLYCTICTSDLNEKILICGFAGAVTANILQQKTWFS